MKFFFGIPLRSRETSQNWGGVVDRLQNTIDSIYLNNIMSDIEVIIVVCGHELPQFLSYKDYLDVVFLKCKEEIPKNQSMYMQDKNNKKLEIVNNITSKINYNEESFFMFLDADDIISVEFIRNTYDFFRSNEVDDMLVMSGYMYDFKTDVYSFLDGINKKFYRNCGSCFVSKVTKEEANVYLKLLKNHVHFPNIAISQARSVKESFGADILYLVNHGTNNSNQISGNNFIIDNIIKTYRVDSNDIKHQAKINNFHIKKDRVC